MSTLEETLSRYKEPSSPTEQEKQERAERMVRGAVNNWSGFEGIGIRFLVKGSYANNTNVRTDSDVDVAVIHKGFYYFDDSDLLAKHRIESEPITFPHYDGADFRAELEKALKAKFGAQCDTSGKTAITIRETSSRVGIDVVPSFQFHQYYHDSWYGVQQHEGTKTRRKNGTWVVNFPMQQLENGRSKNNATNGRYKHQVRILKRLENELANKGRIKPLPSYFMECLIYNVPNNQLKPIWASEPLTAGLKNALTHINNSADDSWQEPNEIKQLFASSQPWTLDDAKELAQAAWNHCGLGD